jgi:hypothetical protein
MDRRTFTAVIFGSMLTTILPNLANAEELSFSYVTDASAGNPGFAVSQWDQSNTPTATFNPTLNGIDVPVTAFLGSTNCCGIDYYGFPVQTYSYSEVTFLSNGGFVTGGVVSYDGGPILYTGTGSNPVFSPSIYQLEGATLTVNAVGGVPETSTWVMSLIGFGALGFAGYRTSRKAILNAA